MEQARKSDDRRLVLVRARPEERGAEVRQRDSATSTREEFEYLTDMIRQLQMLARQTGSSTLAGILELAHHEADLQLRRQVRKVNWFGPA